MFPLVDRGESIKPRETVPAIIVPIVNYLSKHDDIKGDKVLLPLCESS